MSAPTYEIRTLADFCTVPPERLAACLADFAHAVETVRLSTNLLTELEKEMHGEAKIAWPLSFFRWTDDGIEGCTDMKIVADDGEISLFEKFGFKP